MDISEDAVIVCQLEEEEAVKVRGMFVILYFYSCRVLVGSHVSSVRGRGHEGQFTILNYATRTATRCIYDLRNKSASLVDARVFKAEGSAQTQRILSSYSISGNPRLSFYQASRLRSAPSENAMNQILL